MTCEKPYQEYKDAKELLEHVAMNGERPKFNEQIPEVFQLLIEKCWSQEPSERPTFDEVLDELENNKSFITEDTNIEEYQNYINFVKNSNISFENHAKSPEFYGEYMSYSIKEFEISSKDNYDTEMNNISYFLKCMNPKDYQRKRKTTMKKGASGYITVIENKKNKYKLCSKNYQ